MAPPIGRYEILQQLGAGGMGEVFLATDTALRRQVAIKLLPRSSTDEDAQKRMLREARMVATIDHPNVCTIFEIGDDGGRPFIVMQYVPGVTLADRIARTPLTVAEAVDVGRQVTAALGEAHGRGIVHRDIKPGNIMIGPGGLVKVLDFGLAKPFASDAATATVSTISTPGLVAGSVPYMSPEQLRAEPLDGRSDIFSFGVVLYEMVTGRRPFDRPTVAATISAILRDDPPPLHEDGAPLQRVIARALAKPVSRRFASASEMQEALVRLPKRRKTTPAARRKVTVSAQIHSLAVLPLAADISDESIAYVEEGMLERLIARLSHVPALRVIGHATVMRYHGRAIDRARVAEQLGVQALMTGSLAATPSSIRLQLRIEEAVNGDVLWSGDFARSGKEIDAVAAEVAAQVADSIRVRSSSSGATRRRRAHPLPVDPAAEKLYLRGRVQWNKRHADGVRQAILSFQEAVEVDPTYANAHAGLADAYLVLAFLQAMRSADAVPKAKAAAVRAIELDPSLGEPHASLGYAAAFLEWDAPVAHREFEEAMRLNPNYSWAPHWYGLFLAPRSSLAEALHYLTRARVLEPLAPIVNIAIGIPYHLHGQYEEAARIYSNVIDSEARFAPAWFYLGQTLEQLGRFESALEHMEKARELAGDLVTFGGAIAHCYARSGNTEKARALVAELEERARERYVSPYHFMLAHLGLGNTDLALSLFEQALEERAAWLYWTPREPRLDPLRGHPRFQQLVTQYGLAGGTS